MSIVSRWLGTVRGVVEKIPPSPKVYLLEETGRRREGDRGNVRKET